MLHRYTILIGGWWGLALILQGGGWGLRKIELYGWWGLEKKGALGYHTTISGKALRLDCNMLLVIIFLTFLK